MTLELFQYVKDRLNPEVKLSVVTGGQTGFDEAGAKAAAQLGWNVTVNAPKGWKFRNIAGKDISDEKAFKERFGVTQIEAPKTALTDITKDAIKDNKQDYLDCKLS